MLLLGGLGTGKTTFVQGLAEGLEVLSPCRSPSFTMMHAHEGRYPFLHVDLFRCASPQEVDDLGLDQMLDPPYVVAIEWGEKAGSIVKRDYLEVEFEWDDTDDDARLIQFRPFGRWQERMRELGDSVREWAGTGGT